MCERIPALSLLLLPAHHAQHTLITHAVLWSIHTLCTQHRASCASQHTPTLTHPHTQAAPGGGQAAPGEQQAPPYEQQQDEFTDFAAPEQPEQQGSADAGQMMQEAPSYDQAGQMEGAGGSGEVNQVPLGDDFCAAPPAEGDGSVEPVPQVCACFQGIMWLACQ